MSAPRIARSLVRAAVLHLLVLQLGLLAPLAVSAEQAPPFDEATAVVDELHGVLLELMMQADELGYEGRVERLEPVMASLFDLPFMAQKSVGRYWKSASPEEQQQLLDSFQRYIVATYASRFTGFDDQRFETLELEESIQDTVLVHSRVVEKSGDTVELNYRLRRKDGRWRIVDVYLNGTVSELAMRRSEYSALIKREGFAALLTALDAKIEELTPSS